MGDHPSARFPTGLHPWSKVIQMQERKNKYKEFKDHVLKLGMTRYKKITSLNSFTSDELI